MRMGTPLKLPSFAHRALRPAGMPRILVYILFMTLTLGTYLRAEDAEKSAILEADEVINI